MEKKAEIKFSFRSGIVSEEALREIFPGSRLDGHIITIPVGEKPMPIEQVRNAISQATELVGIGLMPPSY